MVLRRRRRREEEEEEEETKAHAMSRSVRTALWIRNQERLNWDKVWILPPGWLDLGSDLDLDLDLKDPGAGGLWIVGSGASQAMCIGMLAHCHREQRVC